MPRARPRPRRGSLRHATLKCLLEHGPSSSAEITRHTRRQRPSVSRWRKEGLLKVVGYGPRKRGHSAAILDLTDEMRALATTCPHPPGLVEPMHCAFCRRLSNCRSPTMEFLLRCDCGVTFSRLVASRLLHAATKHHATCGGGFRVGPLIEKACRPDNDGNGCDSGPSQAGTSRSR